MSLLFQGSSRWPPIRSAERPLDERTTAPIPAIRWQQLPR